MDTQPIFTIDVHTQEDFLNQEEIDKLITGINKEDLLDYSFFKGDAKSSYVAMQEQKPNILDFHSAIQKKILREVSTAAPNQRMADSWCNIQGRDSTLEWHNHPNVVVFTSLSDFNQPFSCSQWGNLGDGIWEEVSGRRYLGGGI